MQHLAWPTLSEILVQFEQGWSDGGRFNLDEGKTKCAEGASRSADAWQQLQAESEWRGAIAALEQLLLQLIDADAFASGDQPTLTQSIVEKEQPKPQGLILSGPSAILSHINLVSSLQSWIFSSEVSTPALLPFQHASTGGSLTGAIDTPHSLSLLPTDPLAAEQFCLVLSTRLSLLMVLGMQSDGSPAFLFSFEPEAIYQGWQLLRPRVLLTSPAQVELLDLQIKQFAPIVPDYRIVTQFSRLLLRNLPALPETGVNDSECDRSSIDSAQVQLRQKTFWSEVPQRKTGSQQQSNQQIPYRRLETLAESNNRLDVELLQAMAHEIRTPLTTIRTLTRLLLKRQDLGTDVRKRLELIDRECTEQIDRFGLIFRAVELETDPVKQSSLQLTTTSLAQVFQSSIPRWQKQASRHNLKLDVLLPKTLPAVVSDPTMLDQVLTGLIESFTRRLPAGSYIRVQVMLAGNQLKLKLQSQLNATHGLSSRVVNPSSQPANALCFSETAKPIGQLLMFQPETGSLSLNIAVTKQLFQALGGRLIVRQRPQEGEVMTIFSP